MRLCTLFLSLLLLSLHAEESNSTVAAYMVLLKSVPKEQPGIETILKEFVDVSCSDCDVPMGFDEYLLSDTIDGLKPGYYVLSAGVYAEKYLAVNYLDCMKERFPTAYLKRVQFSSKETILTSKEYNYIYCKTESAKTLAHELYPLCRPTFNKKAGEGRWSLEISDRGSFTFNGEAYTTYCWAEYHATCVSTNYKEWHRGGLAILKGGTLVCKTSITDCEISQIIQSGSVKAIALKQSAEYHGQVSESLYTFSFDGSSLKQTGYESLDD